MTTKIYTSLLTNPQPYNQGTHKALQKLIKKYPYFQSARALELKYLKNTESYLYNDDLKITAAYTTDRNILFEYITSNDFFQNKIAKEIIRHNKQTLQIEVIAENISEQISLELEEELKAERKKAETILNPDLFQPKHNEKSVKEEEEILKLNKPLPFSKQDKHSFTEWLKLTSVKPIVRNNKPEPKNKEKEHKFDLIEQFIRQKPKLPIPDKASNSQKNINLAAPYTQVSNTLMTETLAKVYVQQKKYSKAIQAYKILILKNPEKSGYFADQIRAIEKLIIKHNP